MAGSNVCYRHSHGDTGVLLSNALTRGGRQVILNKHILKQISCPCIITSIQAAAQDGKLPPRLMNPTAPAECPHSPLQPWGSSSWNFPNEAMATFRDQAISGFTH